MPRVLLVDDEPNIRWTMAEFLKRGGYEVKVAADFEGAISILERDPIDVAVIDIVLPGRSGVELLREVRRRSPNVPAIMITGEPNPSNIPDIVRAGAYDFIPKPVVKDVLLRAVSRAVEKKRLADEKEKLELEIKRYVEQLEGFVAQRTKELTRVHNFLNLVLDSSTEYAIIAIDPGGLINLFNRGAEIMFDRRAAEIIGKPGRELVDESGLAPDERPLLKLGAEAELTGRCSKEMQLRRADGHSFAACVTMTPIGSPDGHRLGYLGIIRDLTEERRHQAALERMREKLAQNEKMSALGRAAAQVAHEIKNPLTGLRLYSLHLKKKLADRLAEDELELLDKIIDTVDHLWSTVERVLDFARPIQLSRRPMDLNSLVASSIHLLEPQISAARIEVQLDLDRSGANCLLDEALMRSALVNLLLNAIQAMPDGGFLKISSASRGNQMLLRISDTGCGMTREQLAKIFEPFYTTKGRGLGLGMSHAKRVIEHHGGRIRVESRPKEGTCVEITLPAGEVLDEVQGEDISG
jgi:PAS domain S-box-containing protein